MKLKTMSLAGLMAFLPFLSAPVMGQGEPVAESRFSPEALRRALPATARSTAQGSMANWERVKELRGQEAVVDAVGFVSREVRIESIDDTAVMVADLGNRSRPTVRISREAVNEVKRWTGRSGSVLGAVIGAGAGAFAGFVTALNLSMKQCGTSCSDEKGLMALSLVGMPLGAGWLGYKLPGGNRALTTVYRR